MSHRILERVFGSFSGSLAEAETERDAYFGARPGYLKEFLRNPILRIELRYTVGPVNIADVQLYNGEGWVSDSPDVDSTLITATGTTTGRSLEDRFADAVSVKDYGAVGDGVQDDTTAIQAALDNHKVVRIPSSSGNYMISNAIFPNTGNILLFEGGILETSQIITTHECAIKIYNAADVEVHDSSIDCNNFPANSGIIVRENTANIRLINTKVVNAAWDAVRGGGRAIIIESNTGAPSNIIVNGLTGLNVDTLIGVNGYFGSRKNNIVISNLVGRDVNKLIALWGNGGTFPHTGDNLTCVISNVIGHNVTQPLRFDRAGSCSIHGVRVFNRTDFPKIGSVVRGTCSNVNVSDFVFEGDATYAYNANPWDDSNGTVDFGYNAIKNDFEFRVIGTVDEILAIGFSGERVEKTNFDIMVEVVSQDRFCTPQWSSNVTCYATVSVLDANVRANGFVDKLQPYAISTYTGKDFSPQKVIGGLDMSAAASVPASNNTYTLGSDVSRLKDVFIFNGIDILSSADGRRYRIYVDGAGNVLATLV